MTQFMDINDDCIDYILKFLNHTDSTSIETMVAISQTCTRLESLSLRYIQYNSYSCAVSTDEDLLRAKRTITKIGKSLVELTVDISKCYTALKPAFLKHIPLKCPDLRKLEIASHLSPNATLDGVEKLQHLEELSVRGYDCIDDIDNNLAVRLATEAKNLTSMRCWGAEWHCKTVVDFINTAVNLDALTFEIEYADKYLCYEISTCFMDEFRLLIITDASELIYFLEYRDLCKNIFN